ncbi:MAG: hypothetical protein V3573_03785 [Desulfovibrionaceae bacterium]
MAKGKSILVLAVVGAILLAAGFFGAKFMAKNVAEQKVKEFFADMDEVAHAEYSDVEVELFSRRAVIRDMDIVIMGGKSVKVKEFVLSRYEEKDGQPYALNAEFRGVTLPVTEELFEDAAPELRRMGYDILYCDYAMDYAYDEKTQLFEVNGVSLGVEDAGKLSFSLKMSNVDMQALAKQDSAKAMLMAINGATLQYSDASLMNRLFKTIAEDQNSSEQVLIDEMNLGLDKEIATAEEAQQAFTVTALKEVKKFLNARKGIKLTLAPDQPVAVLSLLGVQDPADAVQMLNIKVQAD